MSNEQKISELEETHKQLGEQIQELKNPKPKGRWKPEVGEEYFVTWNDGRVTDASNTDNKVDYERFSIGNYYKTKEEAEREVERLKARKRVQDVIDEVNGDWEQEWTNDSTTCCIAFCPMDDKFYSVFNPSQKPPTRHMIKDTASSHKAINKCSDRDLKLFLGIE